MPITDDAGLRAALDSKTIAVVGCSATPGKAAHDIPRYMRDHGYEVIPVNPYADEIFGEEPYDSLDDVPEGVDLVDVFRPSDEVSGIVDQVLAREDVSYVWLQLGITDDASGERLEDSDREFVQDRCLKVEHSRLVA